MVAKAMQTKTLPFLLALTIGAMALFMTGCETTHVNNTKSLLSTAGFRVKKPETPLQKEVYAAMPGDHVQKISMGNKTIYAFKDEAQGVAYVGRAQEYQHYVQLCVQQQIAQDYYTAASMNSYYAHRYYGAWGPRYW